MFCQWLLLPDLKVCDALLLTHIHYDKPTFIATKYV